MQQIRLDGRVAIVTGAGRGIGREHALLLAARGAAVVVNDAGGDSDGSGASTGPAQDVVAEICARGGRALADAHSIASSDGAEATVAAALDRFGRIDALVNNAGITHADWDSTVAVNLSGTFWMCRAVWRHFIAQRYGRIVNTTSAAGLFGLTMDSPAGLDFYAYGAAKMGIVGLTRSLAQVGAKHGIAVNAVAPVAWSRMTATYPDAKLNAWMERNFPASRIAPAAAYLLHEGCAVNGETFSVGGGRMARTFVGETLGHSLSVLSPEDIAANLDQIMDLDGYVVPGDTTEEVLAYKRLCVDPRAASALDAHQA